jgi:arylsulfatase A-like enzyme
MRRALEAGAALLLAGCFASCGPSEPDGPPNIVLITLESLRIDHLEVLGGTRPTAPHLDALGHEAVVYEDAHAVTSWTLASHASIFTGLYPTAHRTTGPKSRLDDSYTTLAEILSENGYQSAGVVSGPYLRAAHNLHQGFELYDDSPAEAVDLDAHADVTNPQMESLLEEFLNRQRDPTRPFFLFAYYWDPHYDYIPPPPYDEMFVDDECETVEVTEYEVTNQVHAGIRPGQLRFVISQYDGEIRWTDESVGKLFRLLKEKGLWEDTAVVVTSDHGEEFFDHGSKGHKHNLYAETVRVPLIIKYPRGRPRGRDARLVSLIDLFPTILDLAGATSPVPQQGKTLIGPPRDLERAIYYELLSIFFFPRRGKSGMTKRVEEWFAVRKGDYKLITIPRKRRVELYDVRKDPEEQVDLAAAETARVQELLETLDRWQSRTQQLSRGPTEGDEAELDPEALERLRSLGYLD